MRQWIYLLVNSKIGIFLQKTFGLQILLLSSFDPSDILKSTGCAF